MNSLLFLLFQFVVLIFSAVIHEVSHGIMAYRLGDDTAKVMGRLSLNPLKHIEMFGSIFLPLFLILSGSPIVVGWAKPVPYNPNNLKNPKSGAALIGIAGPLSNISVAIIMGILIRIMTLLGIENMALLLFLNVIVFLNILLAIFNLVPIPPLDGSKLLFALLPAASYKAQRFLEVYGPFILLFFIFFGFQLIIPIVGVIYKIIAGSGGIY